jgi:hypothetical protein
MVVSYYIIDIQSVTPLATVLQLPTEKSQERTSDCLYSVITAFIATVYLPDGIDDYVLPMELISSHRIRFVLPLTVFTSTSIAALLDQ